METTAVAVLIPVVAIIGGFSIALFAMYQRGKARELRYRERMAMIERGMVPAAPEAALHEGALGRTPAADRVHRTRHASAGVVIAAIGFGLMLLIGFAGDEPGAAIGVGGAVVLLGIAFIVNGFLFHRESGPLHSPDSPPPPPSVPSDEQHPNRP